MKRVLVTLTAVAVSLAVSTASAAPPVSNPCEDGTSCLPTPAPGKIDPKFSFLRHTLEKVGPDAAVFGPEGLPDDADLSGIGASLRFRRVLTPAEVESLARTGVRFTRNDEGSLVRVGAIYSAFVEFEAVDALANHPDLIRAEAAWRPVTSPPLEVTSNLVGAAQSQTLPGLGVDGEGVVIGDIDGGVDPLHPHLFKPDGGQYQWVDDGDGEFSAGQDGVDLNGDGEVGNDEILRVLDATIVDYGGLKNDDGRLQPDVDWLYVDVNNDGERNVGTTDGFTEADPAYGEPLFVVDDVDRDGALEPNEKLIRLKTSKIQKYVLAGRTYRRGIDLIDGANDDAARYAGHGTAVSSILVGGAAGYQSRVGLAPSAEVIMYSTGYSQSPGSDWEDQAPQITDINSAMEDGVDVLLHEWTDPYTAPHDGSGNVEAAMDQARQAGIVQVNPLGNLNLAEKHIEREVAAGASTNLGFEVGSGFQYGNEFYPYTVAYATIFWDGQASPDFTVVAPDGTETSVAYEQQTQVGDDYLWASYEETSRGMRQVVVYLYSQDQQSSLAQGTWKVRIDSVDTTTQFMGRVTDYYSSWSRGIGWTDYVEGVRTMVYPSTADSAVGVAAYGGRHDQQWEGSLAGELRGFSGRGPRFDGAQSVDIAAPDDPYAAMAATPRVVQQGYGRSWFRTFGGTSGAGPHVAAAFALLKANDPDASPDDLEAALFDAADQEDLTPSAGQFPSPLWGHGKIDVYEALFGTDVYEANRAPSASLSVQLDDVLRFDASGSTDPDGDSLQYRFDFDYDGEWDSEWLDEPVVESAYDVLDGPGSYTARVEVRDAVGATSGRLVDYTFDEIPTPDPDPDPEDVDIDVDIDVDDDQPQQKLDDSGGDTDDAGTTSEGCGGCASTEGGALDGAWLVLFVAGLVLRRRRSKMRDRA